MTLTGLAVLLLVSLAAPGDQPLDKAVGLTLVAIEATHEDRPKGELSFDDGLDDVRHAIESHVKSKKLKHNTFKKIKASKTTAKPGKEAILKINKRYTLFATPLSKDSKSRIRLKIRIDETLEKENDKKEKTRKALETTTAIAPGKPLLLGGLDLNDGQLVVVLTATD